LTAEVENHGKGISAHSRCIKSGKRELAGCAEQCVNHGL
jgi:hypothetical protein